MRYAYPAIFMPEANGQFSVRFPDLRGCNTGGNDIKDAIDMAEDALCLTLYMLERDGKEIPRASDIKAFILSQGEFVNLIACDTDEYRKFFASKAVKKTLTIPEWLNDEAERKNVNFSAVLQEALKEYLNL